MMDFIKAVENSTGKSALLEMVEMQPGDVYMTYADTTKLEKEFGYKPQTPIQKGVDSLYKCLSE